MQRATDATLRPLFFSRLPILRILLPNIRTRCLPPPLALRGEGTDGTDVLHGRPARRIREALLTLRIVLQLPTARI
jgi:hypothetical protein